MSKTTLLWLFIYVGGLLTSFIKGPIYGLLTYIFTFYTQLSWAGKYLMEGRWSLLSSIVMLFSYILWKNKEGKASHLKIPQMKFLILFFINMLFVSLFAVSPEANTDTIIAFVKISILYYFMILIIQEKKKYKMFLWLQLWGNFLFSWQGYHEETVRGRLEGIGGPGTSTSNGLANHLIMILPFINNFILFGYRLEKIAACLAAPFILNAIILCNSRGAYLGIIAMGILALIRANKEIRKKILVGLAMGSILFFQLTDQNFWERIITFNNPEEDSSITERFETWHAALVLIKDKPLGVGGDGWLHLSPVYIPGIVEQHGGIERSVHNSYLQVATNYGIQGVIIYFMFISSTLLELRKIRKRYGTKNDQFFHAESTGIELAIWGFLIAAFFGARPYFEAFFWYSALGCALSNIQQSEINDILKEKRTVVVS